MPEPVFLRNFRVLPCISCNACSRAAEAKRLFLPGLSPEAKEQDGQREGALTQAKPLAFGCPQTLRDESVMLLRALLTARALCLAAPIYFYHVPAALKALIDRTQPFWALEEARDPRLAALPPRECRVIFIAARKQGEQLFSGALLTLRQALKPLRVTLAEPLLLRGLEGPGDLASNPGAALSVINYGQAAARHPGGFPLPPG
jgi:hypothetical protein